MIRLLAFAVATLAGALAHADAPTVTQVRQWWDASTPTATIGDPVAITLVGGEQAWLVAVTDWNRGRNFANLSLLVRPKLRKARELALGGSIAVQDIAVNDASVIAMTGSGSGQGTTVSVRSLVQFDGWKPLVLHKVRFADNLGACGDSVECRSTESEWKLSGGVDGSPLVLVETQVSARGKTPEQLVRREKTVRYVLERGHFVAAREDAATAVPP